MLDLNAAVARARELIVFADGLDDAGQTETARRCRLVARDALELAEALAASRSACDAMQTNYQRCLAVIGRRGYGERDVQPVPVAVLEGRTTSDNPFLAGGGS